MKNISPDWNYVIEKYLRGEATVEERSAVDAWYDAFDNNPAFTDKMQKKELEKAVKISWHKLQSRMD